VHWGYDGWWQEDLTHAPLSPMPREEVGSRVCTPSQLRSPLSVALPQRWYIFWNCRCHSRQPGRCLLHV
jgi:hypothetical protein